MDKIISKVVKEVSNKQMDIKKNYKLFRFIQKLLNPNIFNKGDYRDICLYLGERSIKCRIFKSFKTAKKVKVIIFIHGGGWVFGSIESYTKMCTQLSERTKRMVISIDYRLAPEYPYPLGFDDCYDVVNLIMNNLDKLGLNNNDVCLMGDSAGGNLTAAISLKARETKDFEIKQQILLYPVLQHDYSNKTKYKSVIKKGNNYLLTQKNLQDYIYLYVKDKKDLRSPYVSPLNARFPFFQPKTLIVTAENDPLRDEGKAYARKLKLFFNDVTYYNQKGAIHGFLSYPFNKEGQESAYRKIIEFLGDDNEEKR